MTTPTPTLTSRLRRHLVAVVIGALAAGLLAPVSAQAADPVPPTLVSLSTSPSVVTVPGTTSIQLRVAGPDRPAYAQVMFVEPSGRPRTVQLAMVDDGPGHYTGTTSYAVKDGAENGHWKVRQVYLPTPYLSTIVCDSTVQESYCTGHQDFSAVGVDVSGSVFDAEAPVVSAVAVTSPTVHVPDQSLDLSFEVSDVHPITRLELQFRPDALAAQGRYLTAVVKDADQLAAGRASVAIPSAYDSSYQLRWLVTVDSVGNKATYRPDGWVNLEG
ncbi:MAG TPA: hypothetical protein VLI66_08930, partial [Terrabacter sp.]|nr:hypothetical protein [Terrabacter sp.]